MRHWLLALGGLCALSSSAVTQQPSGQVVSNAFTLNPAGTRIPAAAPPVGSNVGSPTMRPYDPFRPLDAFKGTNLNPKNVVAPVTGLPGTQQPDLLDRLYGKLSAATNFLKPSSEKPPQPNVTPGIFRRNRERHKMEWRRD